MPTPFHPRQTGAREVAGVAESLRASCSSSTPASPSRCWLPEVLAVDFGDQATVSRQAALALPPSMQPCPPSARVPAMFESYHMRS